MHTTFGTSYQYWLVAFLVPTVMFSKSIAGGHHLMTHTTGHHPWTTLTEDPRQMIHIEDQMIHTTDTLMTPDLTHHLDRETLIETGLLVPLLVKLQTANPRKYLFNLHHRMSI